MMLKGKSAVFAAMAMAGTVWAGDTTVIGFDIVVPVQEFPYSEAGYTFSNFGSVLGTPCGCLNTGGAFFTQMIDMEQDGGGTFDVVSILYSLSASGGAAAFITTDLDDMVPLAPTAGPGFVELEVNLTGITMLTFTSVPSSGGFPTAAILNVDEMVVSSGGGKTIPGDLDGDGCVSQGDLGTLLAAFNQNDGGDIDGDGVTDQSDLGTLLANFGTGTCK